MEKIKFDFEEIIGEYCLYNYDIEKESDLKNNSLNLEEMSFYVNGQELIFDEAEIGLIKNDGLTNFVNAYHSSDNKEEICSLCNEKTHFLHEDGDWYLSDCSFLQKEEIKEQLISNLLQIVEEYSLDFNSQATFESLQYKNVRFGLDEYNFPFYEADFVYNVEFRKASHKREFTLRFCKSGEINGDAYWSREELFTSDEISIDVKKMPQSTSSILEEQMRELMNVYLKEIENNFISKREIENLRKTTYEISNIKREKECVETKGIEEFHIYFKLNEKEQIWVAILPIEDKKEGYNDPYIVKGNEQGFDDWDYFEDNYCLCLQDYLIDCFEEEVDRVVESKKLNLYKKIKDRL